MYRYYYLDYHGHGNLICLFGVKYLWYLFAKRIELDRFLEFEWIKSVKVIRPIDHT
jgi:hypothetical protein